MAGRLSFLPREPYSLGLQLRLTREPSRLRSAGAKIIVNSLEEVGR